MSKVSIIIPIYNAEEYIAECVESLFKQTMTDLEYIFIDDCSPDNSVEILKRYLDKYPERRRQVKLIRHTENKGVSASRQEGVEAATGDYIIHCDPDDWVDTDIYQCLYDRAIETNAEVVICDYYESASETQKIHIQKPSSADSKLVIQDFFENLHGNCWNKLIKRSIITDNNIRFTPGLSFCEDLVYNISLFSVGVKIEYLPRALYHYRVGHNANSLVNSYSFEKYVQDQNLYELIVKKITGSGYEQKCKSSLALIITRRALLSGIFDSKSYRKNFSKYFIHIVKATCSFQMKAATLLSLIGFYKPIHKLYIKRGF